MALVRCILVYDAQFAWSGEANRCCGCLACASNSLHKAAALPRTSWYGATRNTHHASLQQHACRSIAKQQGRTLWSATIPSNAAMRRVFSQCQALETGSVELWVQPGRCSETRHAANVGWQQCSDMAALQDALHQLPPGVPPWLPHFYTVHPVESDTVSEWLSVCRICVRSYCLAASTRTRTGWVRVAVAGGGGRGGGLGGGPFMGACRSERVGCWCGVWQ